MCVLIYMILSAWGFTFTETSHNKNHVSIINWFGDFCYVICSFPAVILLIHDSFDFTTDFKRALFMFTSDSHTHPGQGCQYNYRAHTLRAICKRQFVFGPCEETRGNPPSTGRIPCTRTLRWDSTLHPGGARPMFTIHLLSLWFIFFPQI